MKPDNYEKSIWLSERDGYHPVFFEEKLAPPGGKPEVRTTEVSWQRTPGGHLFPQRVKYNTFIILNGDKHASEDVTTVTHADFDSPIDPAVFTIAGLGLNENQAIGFPGLETANYPLWRNGKIDYGSTLRKQVEESAKSHPNSGQSGYGQPANAPYPSQGNTTLVVAIVAALLAIATAVAAVVIRRRRAAE